MRRVRWSIAIALTLLTAVQAESFAQRSPDANGTRGLFGDRTLGRSLQPRPRTSGGGIERAPGGAFIGRAPNTSGRTTFSATARAPAPNRITGRPAGPVVNTYGYGPVEISKPLVGPERPMRGVDSPAQGDVWFRDDAPSRRSPTASGAPVAAGGSPATGLPPAGASTTGRVAPSRPMWNGPLPGSGPMRFVRGEPGSREAGFGRSSSRFESTADRLSRRISKNPGIASDSGIVVSMNEGVATLRGAVASPRDRTLAGHLARFEPGVAAVNNQLVVPGEN